MTSLQAPSRTGEREHALSRPARRFFEGARGSTPQTFPHDLSGGLRTLRPVAPSTHQLGIRMLLPESRTAQIHFVHGDAGLQVVEVVSGSLASPDL